MIDDSPAPITYSSIRVFKTNALAIWRTWQRAPKKGYFMLSYLRDTFKKNEFLYRAAICAGLTYRARRACRRAREAGATLSFRLHHIRWQRGSEVVLFPYMEPDSMLYFLRYMPTFLPKLVFRKQGSLQIADCRAASEYHLPSGRTAWLPVIAEPLDFLTGYFEKGKPQLGQVVLDAGAYCGEVAIELAHQVGPTGRVFAFEPDPKNWPWLLKNIEASGLSNITPIRKGLWQTTTTLEFISSGHAGSALSKNADPMVTGDLTRIEVLSPSDVFALIGGVPDFIKMDIEGAEVEVLNAMAPLLNGASPRFAIASYHRRDGGKTSELITPGLQSHGFHVETGYPEHQTTWAWRSAPQP